MLNEHPGMLAWCGVWTSVAYMCTCRLNNQAHLVTTEPKNGSWAAFAAQVIQALAFPCSACDAHRASMLFVLFSLHISKALTWRPSVTYPMTDASFS